MKNKNSDKKLDRLSKFLDIITNLGTIGSWFLGIGSAYVLNIQKFPVVLPGINITLDVYFQFSLIICGILAYVHFLQNFWKRNVGKMELSETFYDFVFWDIPRFKLPLLLIPLILISAVSGQITQNSVFLPTISILMYLIIFIIIVSRFAYYLSPQRKIEDRMSRRLDDQEWIDRWTKRIDEKISLNGYAYETDLQDAGYAKNHEADIEIRMAMANYFHQNEFSKNILFVKSDSLDYLHPLRESFPPQWLLLKKELRHQVIEKS